MTDLHQEFERSHLFHKARIDRRSADALLGVTAGLVADGNINQMEAAFLKTWIETHLLQLEDPVVNILYQRLASMLSDGALDAEESAELLEMLHQFSGISVGSPQRPLCCQQPAAEQSGSDTGVAGPDFFVYRCHGVRASQGM